MTKNTLPDRVRVAHDGSKLYFAARNDEGAEYIRADLVAQKIAVCEAERDRAVVAHEQLAAQLIELGLFR